MDNLEQIKPVGQSEGIDFNKLSLIIRKNLIWIVLIFITINTSTYLLLRYWPDQYESYSELKLDVNSEASDFGFKSFVDESQNLISGEIELIRSKLFLNRVLDSLDIDVSYFNKGDVLNFELFRNSPFFVNYKITNSSFYNIPFFIDENNDNSFTLRMGESGPPLKGNFRQTIKVSDGLELILTKNPDFKNESNAELNCFFIIHSRSVLIDYLLKNLSVAPLNFNANTIKISFKDRNPSKAATIINKIDSLYLLYSNEQKNQANKQKIDWLSSELSQIEIQLGEFENYFEDFVLENKTNDLNQELRHTISLINEIDSQRYNTTKKITIINKLMEELSTDQFFINPVQTQSFPQVINENLTKLQILQEEMNNLKLSYSEVTFAYQKKQNTINNVQKEVKNQLADLKKAWLKDLEELNNKKRQLENNFTQMPNRNTQFNKNQRFYQLYEEFYLSLMQSKSEFEIAQAGTTPDFKILSHASVSGYPIAPNKLMITGIGLVASIIINLFFIGILYLLNNKITNLQELEYHSGVPVLGIIPASHYIKESSIHVKNHPRSMVSEAFRSLRTNLDFFNISSPVKTITISSTVSGEGKSYIAMNLGGVLALSKKKVILIDLDMRKIKAEIPVELRSDSKGISTMLIKKNTLEECVVKTELENLDYLPAGPQPPNPSELLLNGAFTSILENLKSKYDYIILDTPPVGLVTDGIMAMKHSDISIYVFRANYSKKEFLLNLKRIKVINKFSNITTILNALPSRDKTYGYGYYEKVDKKKKLKSIFKIFSV